MGGMAEVAVTTIVAPNPGAFTLDGTRSYVLNQEVIIDPGPEIPSHVEALMDAAPRLKAIFVTHRHLDHTPATVPLKQKTGAAVFAPPGVLTGIADEHLRDDGIWHLDTVRLEAIATPGHTAEHFAFLTADGALFTGDAILGSGTTIVEGNMQSYVESLRKMRARIPRRIYPGHGPHRDDAVEWIDYYIAHRLERERQVLDAVANGARSAQEIRAMVYPEVDPRLAGAAELQVRAHLDDLVARGRLMHAADSYKLPE